MDFETIKAKADKYFMATYGRFNAAPEKGKSATLTDSEGKKYIDFTSGIGVNSLGYADAAWVDAVAGQAAKLQHISNLYYNEPSALLAEKLCEMAGFEKVLFCNSGAEANECAIKIARKYSFDHYGEGRGKVITLVNSFHGRTMATLSATGQDVFHNYFFPFPEGFTYAEANNLDALKQAVDDTVCAVIMEPIQGEGGVMPLDKEYVKAAAEFLAEKDILLIFDEVQTGVGRTGKLYAWEHFGVKPDILTSAKGLGGGLPIGACLAGEKCANVLTKGTHGTTFGANPVVCAGALQVLERLSPEFLTKVRAKGEYFKSQLLKIDGIKSVRGEGLMLGAELESGTAADVAAKCVEKGLLVLTAKTLLRFLPPLVITYDEIDEGMEILKNVIENN